MPGSGLKIVLIAGDEGKKKKTITSFHFKRMHAVVFGISCVVHKIGAKIHSSFLLLLLLLLIKIIKIRISQ